MVQNFIPRLREHLLRHFLQTKDTDFACEQHEGIEIYRDRLFRHSVFRVNYTTYDMRRDQDSINPRTHPDIMLVDPDGSDDDPYWYARVIDIFHVNARYCGPGSTPATRKWQQVDVLWVRWLKRDTDTPSGFLHRRLPRVHFVAADDPDGDAQFGFVNPDDVLRASYLIPAFNDQRTCKYLGPSKLARRLKGENPDHADWAAFYVCMYVPLSYIV